MVINTNYELEIYKKRRGEEYNAIFKKVADAELL